MANANSLSAVAFRSAGDITRIASPITDSAEAASFVWRICRRALDAGIVFARPCAERTPTLPITIDFVSANAASAFGTEAKPSSATISAWLDHLSATRPMSLFFGVGTLPAGETHLLGRMRLIGCAARNAAIRLFGPSRQQWATRIVDTGMLTAAHLLKISWPIVSALFVVVMNQFPLRCLRNDAMFRLPFAIRHFYFRIAIAINSNGSNWQRSGHCSVRP